MCPRWATGTPTLPTSPRDISESGSYPVWVGRSKAIDSPVWPFARFVRYSSFDAAAVECPEYVRINQGWSRSRCSLVMEEVWWLGCTGLKSGLRAAPGTRSEISSENLKFVLKSRVEPAEECTSEQGQRRPAPVIHPPRCDGRPPVAEVSLWREPRRPYGGFGRRRTQGGRWAGRPPWIRTGWSGGHPGRSGGR